MQPSGFVLSSFRKAPEVCPWLSKELPGPAWPAILKTPLNPNLHLGRTHHRRRMLWHALHDICILYNWWYIYISLCIITYLCVWLWRAIFCIVWSVFHDRTRAPHHSLARIRCMALQVKEDVDLGPFRQSHRKGLIDDWGLKMLHVDSVDTSDKCKKKTRWQKRSCTLSASCWRSLCHWTLILGGNWHVHRYSSPIVCQVSWRLAQKITHDESVRRSAWRVLPWGWRKTLAYDGIQDSGRI